MFIWLRTLLKPIRNEKGFATLNLHTYSGAELDSAIPEF